MKSLVLAAMALLCTLGQPASALTGPYYRQVPAGCEVRPDQAGSGAGPIYDVRGFYVGYFQPLPYNDPRPTYYVDPANSYSPSASNYDTTPTFGFGGYGYGGYGYGGYRGRRYASNGYHHFSSGFHSHGGFRSNGGFHSHGGFHSSGGFHGGGHSGGVHGGHR